MPISDAKVIGENAYQFDLSRFNLSSPIKSYHHRPGVRFNNAQLGDRVQLIGQGFVRPDVQEIASGNYISAERGVFLWEAPYLYISFRGFPQASTADKIEVTQFEAFNPGFFWLPLLGFLLFSLTLIEKKSTRWWYLPILLALISGFIAAKHLSSMKSLDVENHSLVSDFLKPAFNLFTHGHFTNEDIDGIPHDKVIYKVRREPLLSFLLLPFVWHNSGENKLKNYADYLKWEYKFVFPNLKYLLFVLLVGTAVLTGIIVFRFTANLLAASITSIAVSSSPTLAQASLGIRDTTLIALTLLAFSFCFYMFLERKSINRAVLLGLSFALAALSRASFPFAFIGLLVFVLSDLISEKRKNLLTRSLKFYGISLLTATIILGIWAARNFFRTGDGSVNSYGYGLASVRLMYHQMTGQEVLEALGAWAPEMTPAYWVALTNNPKSRFNPINKNSFRQQELNTDRHAKKKYKNQNVTSMSDSIKKVLSSPFIHLATTAPLFYRGAFPEGWRGARDSNIWLRLLFNGGIHLFFYLSMSILMVRSWSLRVFFAPTICFMLFNAFCTHNIQRYNFPIIPLLYIAGLIFLFEGFKSKSFKCLNKQTEKLLRLFWRRVRTVHILSVIVAFIVAGILANRFFAFEKNDHQLKKIENFTSELLEEALVKDSISFVRYKPDGDLLEGFIRSDLKEQLEGDYFEISANLPKKLHDGISSKKLTSDRFFSWISDLDLHQEYMKHLNIAESSQNNWPSGPLKNGDETILNVRAFGINAGTVEIKILPLVASNDVATIVVDYHLKTADSFRSFYDFVLRGKSYIDANSFNQVGHQLYLQDGFQQKAEFSIVDRILKRNIFWRRTVNKKHGFLELQKVWDIDPKDHNIVSALMNLRRIDPSKGLQMSIFDQGKVFTISSSNITKTSLKGVRAVKIDLIIIDDKKKTEHPISIWLSDDKKRSLLKITSQLQLGEVTAEAVSF